MSDILREVAEVVINARPELYDRMRREVESLPPMIGVWCPDCKYWVYQQYNPWATRAEERARAKMRMHGCTAAYIAALPRGT
jgi:hypothetical protein